MSARRTRTAALATAAVQRDRVLDAVKALALLIVVVAHCLAWVTWDPSRPLPAVTVLEVRPGAWWVTWLQVLPLFFAVGAVGNLASWRRRPHAAPFWQRRMLRLGTPALVYAVVCTAVTLPVALVLPATEPVGRLMAYHLWFLGVYGLVVLAVPLTARWAARPWLILPLWLGLVAAVDLLRMQGLTALAAVNFVLVWGWVHQVGYALPRLRTVGRPVLVAGGFGALLAAAALAGLGPYSRALVSFAGDPELSNLAPPTLVLALFGLGEVLLLAAVWPWLAQLLDDERLWHVVGGFAARAIGIYLWHVPLLMVLVAGAMALGLDDLAVAFGPGWWLVHLALLALVLAATWQVAGLAGLADVGLQRWLAGRRRRGVPVALAAALVPLTTVAVAMTGFGTWQGAGPLGLPSSTPVALALLLLTWFALGVARVPPPSGGGADQPDGVPLLDVPEPPRRDRSLGQQG